MADDDKIRLVSHTHPSPGWEPSDAPVALSAGTVLAARYDIRQTLGRGGMGIVFLAHDRVLREDVALKVLRPEYAAERRWTDRLAREVRLARQIRHPNVCRIFDFEEADGHTFIVMELAPGGTLRSELEGGMMRARSLAARVADARAIVAGLTAIHDAGVVHRDVNPQNVLRMADGRLVVSDFGLAVGVGETTTSIQGGTVAYMSPEVVRGGRASFESDVWSLGVVLHEVVFGQKPNWRSPTSFELEAPAVGRQFTREEAAVLQACRDCTTADRARRPRRAGDVAARLAGRGQRSTRRWRRAFVYGGLALALAVGGALTLHRAPPSASNAHPNPPAPDLIVPTGEPADWTDVSKVLLTVNERVRCLVVLPDRRTVRLVWGARAHAEDVDVTTGRHGASPLVTAAYQEGCPDLSRDGSRLLFQGYSGDGRAFAYVSRRSDGAHAEPVVPIDDPSVLSDPKWLPDGASFVFDSDLQHAGVYSLNRKRATILPYVTRANLVTFFRYVVGETVFIEAVEDGQTGPQFVGFKWPWLSEQFRFRLPKFALDLSSSDGRAFYLSYVDDAPVADVIRIEPSRREARRVGFVRDMQSRFFSSVVGGAVLVANRYSEDLWATNSHGISAQVTHSGDVSAAVRCGADFLIDRHINGIIRLERIAANGSVIAQVTAGPDDGIPACSADGTEWFFSRFGTSEAGTYRCTAAGCTRLLDIPSVGNDVSPDGKRLLYLASSGSGPRVRWMTIDGKTVRDVSDSETTCSPGWSSPTTIWVSRRLAGRLIWTEVDADTAAPTGKVHPGRKSCLDGADDPDSPVHSDVRIVTRVTSQLRFIPADKLTR
jgi:hypothetical protein